MCMICVDYQLQKLTFEEAFKNLDEMLRCGDIDEGHAAEIIGMVLNKEMDLIYEEFNLNLDNIFI